MKQAKILVAALVALKNLQRTKGVNVRDICHYIASTYNVPKHAAKRQIVVALKKGTAYGILKESAGRYHLLTDTRRKCAELTNQELGLLDLICRRRKLIQRKRKEQKKRVKFKRTQKIRKSSKGKRNKRSRRKKSVASKKKKKKKRGRSKSRGSRMRSCTCPPSRRRSGGKSIRRSHSRRSKGRNKRSISRKSRRARSRSTRTRSRTKTIKRSRSRSRSKQKHRTKSKSRMRKSNNSGNNKMKSSKKKKSKQRSSNKRRPYCDCPDSVRRGGQSSRTPENCKTEKQKDKLKKENKNFGAKKDNGFIHFFRRGFKNHNENNDYTSKLVVNNNWKL